MREMRHPGPVPAVILSRNELNSTCAAKIPPKEQHKHQVLLVNSAGWCDNSVK